MRPARRWSSRPSAALAAIALVAGLAGASAPATGKGKKPASRNKALMDATVVAVLDFTMSPYHWDFAADRMPQALDKDTSNDLPLDRPPHTWLPGFPQPGKAFDSYKSIDLTLSKDPTAPIAPLDQADAAKWAGVRKSTATDVNYYWMPDTKVIGAVEFGSAKIHGPTSEHGTGVTSVSVGNIHGTCPECLLVFVDIDGSTADAENAMEWVTAQPWIDVVTNSYGHGDAVPKIYNGRTVPNQRTASVRGQSIFFSAGNGFENAYAVTNPTYMSSQKGPDWLITVGAVSPGSHGSYIGHGKPADVASLGGSYPSAYTATTVSGTGNSGFGGTSNAAPTIAGTYARALYLARRDLRGPSRVQSDGVIARGAKFRCGAKRKACELGDGKLTATELRTRLFHGAVHTAAGQTTLLGGTSTPAIGEDEFLSEGHGTYFAREKKNSSDWLKEFERILAPLEGRAKVLARPDGEREWMIVDSFCRQHLWGSWKDGYYVAGKTALPGPDPTFPVRTSLENGCPLAKRPG